MFLAGGAAADIVEHGAPEVREVYSRTIAVQTMDVHPIQPTESRRVETKAKKSSRRKVEVRLSPYHERIYPVE